MPCDSRLRATKAVAGSDMCAEPLTRPGTTRLSTPTRSRCSSTSFCRFSSRARLCWSAVVTSVMTVRASVGRGPSVQAPGGG